MATNLLRSTESSEMMVHDTKWSNIFKNASASGQKDIIARALADRCRDNEAFKALAETLHNSSYQTHYYGDHVIEACSTLVHCWAISSNNSLLALALQQAAAKEFNVTDYARYGSKMTDNGKIDDAAAKAEFGAHLEALRFFLRQMWTITQEDFAKRNITHVLLFRGAGVGYFSHRENKNGLSTEARTRKVALRPLSAFSTNMETAVKFGGKGAGHVLIGAWVPVENIISTSKTGFGCLNEREMVVISGKDAWWMHYSKENHVVNDGNKYSWNNGNYTITPRLGAYSLLSVASKETKKIGRPRKTA